MKRTKRIKNIIEKNFMDFGISVTEIQNSLKFFSIISCILFVRFIILNYISINE